MSLRAPSKPESCLTPTLSPKWGEETCLRPFGSIPVIIVEHQSGEGGNPMNFQLVV